MREFIIGCTLGITLGGIFGIVIGWCAHKFDCYGKQRCFDLEHLTENDADGTKDSETK